MSIKVRVPAGKQEVWDIGVPKMVADRHISGSVPTGAFCDLELFLGNNGKVDGAQWIGASRESGRGI